MEIVTTDIGGHGKMKKRFIRTKCVEENGRSEMFHMFFSTKEFHRLSFISFQILLIIYFELGIILDSMVIGLSIKVCDLMEVIY